MNIIETKNLTKSYTDFTAVSGINLHIPKGAVYGFLGPNGAGKSTTMKMFLGLPKSSVGVPAHPGKLCFLWKSGFDGFYEPFRARRRGGSSHILLLSLV